MSKELRNDDRESRFSAPEDEAAYRQMMMTADGEARARAALAGEGTRDCQECGEEIEEKRRKAMPNAKQCFRCKQIEERRTGERRGR